MDQTEGYISILVICFFILFFGGFYFYFSQIKKVPCPCWYVQLLTWASDYTIWFWVLYAIDEIVRGLEHNDGILMGNTDDLIPQVKDAGRALILTPITITCACTREWVHYKLLGDRVANAKRDKVWDRWDLFWILMVATVAMQGIFMQSMLGFFHWTEILIDFTSYYNVCVEYWFMSWIKDIFIMATAHAYAHKEENSGGIFATAHAIHHSRKDETDAITMYKFHPVDLVAENICGPAVLLTIKFIFTWQMPKVHLAAYLMQSIHEIASHSCNPYSVLTFCPVFDLIFLGNIAHTLHHASIYPTRWNTIWPIHHLSFTARRADIKLYNDHFGTNFKFLDVPWQAEVERRASSLYSQDGISAIENKSGAPESKEIQDVHVVASSALEV